MSPLERHCPIIGHPSTPQVSFVKAHAEGSRGHLDITLFGTEQDRSSKSGRPFSHLRSGIVYLYYCCTRDGTPAILPEVP